MMGGEGCKPVNSQISYPDNKDWEVDWEYPKHQYEDRMCIVVEIVIGLRVLKGISKYAMSNQS
jgi:hypothetical protein